MAHEFDTEIDVEENPESASEEAAPAKPGAAPGEADAPASKEERADPTDIFGSDAEGGEDAAPVFDFPEIEGHEWTDADQPVLNSFLEMAREKGMSQEAIQTAAEWYVAQLQANAGNLPPETPDGYQVPQIEGVEWTDADKPVLNSFMAAAHSAGLPQQTVDHLTTWFYQAVGEQNKAQRAIDQADVAAAREALQSSWGGEAFKQNLGAVKTQLDKLPDGLGSHIRSARTADGRLLVNQPGFLNLLLSRESRTPPTRADRKAKIEAVMRTDMNRYWSTPGLDQEYQQILAEEEKNK
jgi:hypothetical protein